MAPGVGPVAVYDSAALEPAPHPANMVHATPTANTPMAFFFTSPPHLSQVEVSNRVLDPIVRGPVPETVP